MGISATMAHWIHRLYRKKVLPQGGSILEFGPQRVNTSQATLKLLATDLFGPSVDHLLERIVTDQAGAATAKAFYKMFGFDEYRSFDYSDRSADLLLDLNYVYNGPDRFDAITNFGTSEHIYNIGATFHSAHNITKTGGVMLFVLPAYGDSCHGFYNIHPNIYTELALANRYLIRDFVYMDNFVGRHHDLERNPTYLLNFEALPVKLSDFSTPRNFERKVAHTFFQNMAIEEQKTDPTFVCDYCFVALQKIHDVPFIYPSQSVDFGGVRES